MHFTCWVSHVHHVHVIWTDRDGNVGLCWNMLKQLSEARISTAHVGDCMSAVHVVHDVEVAHFIIRCTPVDKRQRRTYSDTSSSRNSFMVVLLDQSGKTLSQEHLLLHMWTKVKPWIELQVLTTCIGCIRLYNSPYICFGGFALPSEHTSGSDHITMLHIQPLGGRIESLERKTVTAE